jgi:CheY-like chemotaxis protein
MGNVLEFQCEQAIVAPPPPARMPRSILIVDDEPGITRALARLFQRDGYQVETAGNGRVALADCHVREYDLILCDLRMPELDGRGFYQALAHSHPHLCPRVVFLTAEFLSPELQAFLDRTRVPCLPKPCTVARLRETLKRCWAAGPYGVEEGAPPATG